MMKQLIALAVAATFGRERRTRARVTDVAFAYRMGAGFPGDVNRVHPASIEPCLIDVTSPPTAYGQATLVDATSHGVRRFVAGDTAVDTTYGVTCRPYPIQASTGTAYGGAALGSAASPATGITDVLRSGYIMASIPAGQAPVKGGAVFVWCAASTGAHVQGGFEAAASGGNTAALDPEKYSFNGGVDSTGNVEICVNI